MSSTLLLVVFFAVFGATHSAWTISPKTSLGCFEFGGANITIHVRQTNDSCLWILDWQNYFANNTMICDFKNVSTDGVSCRRNYSAAEVTVYDFNAESALFAVLPCTISRNSTIRLNETDTFMIYVKPSHQSPHSRTDFFELIRQMFAESNTALTILIMVSITALLVAIFAVCITTCASRRKKSRKYILKHNRV